MKSLLLLFITNISWAANDVVLQDISKTIENGRLVVEYTFDQPVDSRKVNLDFINQTVQLDVPKAYITEKKRFTNVEDEKLKSFYSYQLNNDTLRLRMIYNDLESSGLQDKVKTSFINNKLKVTIDDGRIPLKAVATSLPDKKPEPTKIQVEDLIVSEEVGQQILEKNQDLAKSIEVEQEKTPEEIRQAAAYDESKIPVFGATVSEEKGESDTYMNRFTIFSVVALIFLLGVYLLLRRWSKVKFKNPHTHIKVLTQHHLGPKKTLAIVSVAGESILVGITDQNINMIKTLSLLEEEIPGETPARFDSAMETAEEREEDRENGVEDDTFQVSRIKDLVNTKLKGMREL